MRFIFSILTALALCSNAAAAVYYVSQTETNGYAVGVDANSGAQAQSQASPWLTIDKAISGSAAGDTIVLNDGVYAFATFGNINKTLTVNAETPLGATLRGTSTARVLNTNQGLSDITLTLGSIILDAQNLALSCVTTTADTGVLTLILNGTKFIEPTQNFVSVTAAKVNLTARNIIGSGTAIGRNGIVAQALTQGTIDIDGFQTTQNGNNMAGTGAVVLKAIASGVVASVKNVTGSITLSSALTGNGQHLGVQIYNIANALIDSCNVDINNNPGTRVAVNYWISADPTTPIQSDGGVISNCRGANRTTGGILALIGQDSSSVAAASHNKCNNGKIFKCNMTGSANSTSLHGFALGNQSGGEMYSNVSDNVAIGLLAKGQTGGIVRNNLAINQYGQGLRSKGSSGTKFYNNTVFLTGGYGILADHDPDFSVYSSLPEFKNNIIYAGGPITQLVYTAPGSTAIFENNAYYSTVALPANPWVYQSTNYAAITGWRAAKELLAVFGDPLLKADYHLRPGSPCINAGVDVGLTTDLDGRAIRGLPDSGAYEYVAPHSGGGMGLDIGIGF